MNTTSGQHQQVPGKARRRLRITTKHESTFATIRKVSWILSQVLDLLSAWRLWNVEAPAWATVARLCLATVIAVLLSLVKRNTGLDKYTKRIRRLFKGV